MTGKNDDLRFFCELIQKRSRRFLTFRVHIHQRIIHHEKSLPAPEIETGYHETEGNG